MNNEVVMESGGTSGNNEKVLVVPDRTDAFKGLHGVALVGKTVNLETLVDFNRLLKIAGTEYVRLQYLGGLSIHISFKDEESARRFLDEKSIWGPWFSKLDTWNGQSLPRERVAWLKILGVPLHILDPGTIDQIGEMFGKVLYVPKMLEEEQDLSMSRVGILVGESFRVKEVVSLKWKNRYYRGMVEEEEEVWVPDFLKNSVVASSGEVSPMQSSPVAHFPVDHLVEAERLSKLDSQVEGQGSSTANYKGGVGKGGNFENSGGDSAACGPDVGSSSKMVGEEPNKIFFFHSKKRQRRCRRKSGRTHSSPHNLERGNIMDSLEKVRPSKRCRAQFSGDVVGQGFNGASDPISPDPFSLNRLLDQYFNNKIPVAKDQTHCSFGKEALPSAGGLC
ncbi:hypothetical protein HanPSC8_Chr11g0462851 [Helianthus annuus]|nr:hypothetical protein HanIR_Chr11g0517191 [Helianthus annuus]KAJ0874327.1 hypothetical protein HanPSC8_Chr11g0462851 [Helianthus annuus]